MTVGTVAGPTVTGGVVTVGSVGTGGRGGRGGTTLSGTVGTCGRALGASLVGVDEGAADAGDDCGFGSGLCVGPTGVGAARREAGAPGCVVTRPFARRSTSLGFVAAEGRNSCTATRWR